MIRSRVRNVDIRQAAAYFNDTRFDVYDFDTLNWGSENFRGNLKYAIESFSINNLSARKRMLFVEPDAEVSPVFRISDNGAVFMLEGPQPDYIANTQYQKVYNVHEALGVATINRRAPAGLFSDPGWAVDSMVESTFGDYTFQRVTTDQDDQVNQYGLYTVFLPSNSGAIDHDSVTVGGKTFFLLEVYTDQGLICGRTTGRPDARVDLVYHSMGAAVYDPNTLTTVRSDTPFNVTAQIDPVKLDEITGGTVVHDAIKVLIDKTWIGVMPKLNDEIVWSGKRYRVTGITSNSLQDQWELMASV